jgi:hypothetical protein
MDVERRAEEDRIERAKIEAAAAARAKTETDWMAKMEADYAAKMEAEARAKAEVELKRVAEEEAEAARLALLEAEKQAKLETEKQERLEWSRRARAEVDRQAKEAEERRVMLVAEKEAKAKAAAEQKTKAKAAAMTEQAKAEKKPEAAGLGSSNSAAETKIDASTADEKQLEAGTPLTATDSNPFGGPEEAALALTPEEAELIEMREKFEDIDKDGSGELDEAELKALLQNLFKEQNPEEKQAKLEKDAKKKAKEILKTMDTDKSGTVDFAEFSAWWKDNKEKKDAGFFGGFFGKKKKDKEQKSKAPDAESVPEQPGRVFGIKLSEPSSDTSLTDGEGVPVIFTQLLAKIEELAPDQFHDCPRPPGAVKRP